MVPPPFSLNTPPLTHLYLQKLWVESIYQKREEGKMQLLFDKVASSNM